MRKPLVDKDCLLEKFSGKGGWTYAEIPEVQITSLLFLPYCALGVVHLIQRYNFETNMLLVIVGFVIVVVNLLIMNRIMRK